MCHLHNCDYIYCCFLLSELDCWHLNCITLLLFMCMHSMQCVYYYYCFDNKKNHLKIGTMWLLGWLVWFDVGLPRSSLPGLTTNPSSCGVGVSVLLLHSKPYAKVRNDIHIILRAINGLFFKRKRNLNMKTEGRFRGLINSHQTDRHLHNFKSNIRVHIR